MIILLRNEKRISVMLKIENYSLIIAMLMTHVEIISNLVYCNGASFTVINHFIVNFYIHTQQHIVQTSLNSHKFQLRNEYLLNQNVNSYLYFQLVNVNRLILICFNYKLFLQNDADKCDFKYGVEKMRFYANLFWCT